MVFGRDKTEERKVIFNLNRMKKEDWISVKEKLPDEITNKGKGIGVSHHVLVTEGGLGTKWVAYYIYSEAEWVLAHGIYSADMKNRNPAYWMPLPENP